MAAKSTEPEAPAEAASDTPTGNPTRPNPTLPEGVKKFADAWNELTTSVQEQLQDKT